MEKCCGEVVLEKSVRVLERGVVGKCCGEVL